MRSRLLSVFLAIAGLGFEAPVALVEDSKPRAVIVVGSGAQPDGQSAARELARFIRKATGADLPVVQTAAAGRPRILVGPAACAPEIRERIQRLRPDGFLIQADRDSVILAGNGREGTSYAIYSFLERAAGVRWLWPGETGEVVPRRESLKVEQQSIVQEPAWLWRDLGPGGALWGALDKWAAERWVGVSEEHQRLEKLWEMHNRFGGLRIYGGHAFAEILPPVKYGLTHPEYYALVNGKRDWQHFDGKHATQPCTSNPDAVRVTTEYVQRFFKEHPDYDAFSISLNDGRGFCECDRCRRLDSGAIMNASADPETGKAGRMPVITDRILTFANEVAAGLARTNPDKMLILFAYGPYKQPSTKIRPAANLIIQYTFHAAENWNPEAEERQLRETGDWSGLTKQLAVYEYFTQGNSPDLPRLMPEPIQRSVQRLREQGFLYYQTQSGDGHAINGLNNYILARLLWDPSADVKAIQADYVEKGFGKAAAPMARYFQRIENQWKEQNGKPVAMDSITVPQYRAVAQAYPPQFRAACRQDLAEALRLAEGQERERVRVVQQGWQYVDLTLSAVEKTLPLLEAGWKFSPSVTAPPGAGKGQIHDAVAAWEERDRYVEAHKQDFVLSYVWVRYNDRNRSFVPLRKMREFEAGSPLPVPKLTPKQESEWRSQIKAELFVPNPLPDLAPKTHSRFEPADGVIAERVTYGTEFGMRVPAILYLPKTHTGRIPAMVVVNGHGGDKYAWYSFYTGILYARGGTAVLTYDPAGEGERNIERKSETRAHDKVQPPEELPRYVGGLMMTDLMQAVSYLSQRPEIDSQRIGATGYSLGSFVVTLTCAVDTRLHACVPVGGGNLDGPGEYWDNTKLMCTRGPYRSLMFLGDRGAAIYALHASRGPTLVFNGTADTVVAIPSHGEAFLRDLQHRVAELRGTTKGIFEIGFEPNASHRPFFVTRPVVLWLARNLGFPRWTEADIRAMPETHISEWARSQRVELDPLYATEDREGGVRALGAGVPGLSRQSLTVFSDEEWRQHKDELIFESWVKAARARIQRESAAR
jgi:dienelactone hydrolase